MASSSDVHEEILSNSVSDYVHDNSSELEVVNLTCASGELECIDSGIQENSDLTLLIDVESILDQSQFKDIDVEHTQIDKQMKLPNEDETITIETKIESAVRNWTIDRPNIRNSNISSILYHLNVFSLDMILTARTLKDEDNIDVIYQQIFNGRYTHLNNLQDSLICHQYVHFNQSSLPININVDGILIFNDSRRFHAYHILLKLCTNPCKIICACIYLSELARAK